MGEAPLRVGVEDIHERWLRLWHCDVPPVGADARIGHGRAGEVDRRAERPGCGGVPQAQRLIEAGGGEQPPIGTRGGRVDEVVMPVQGRADAPGARVGEADEPFVARDDERGTGPERRVILHVAEARAAADVEVVAGECPEVDEAVGAVVLNGCERATVRADRRRWTEVARADARVERASEAPVADEVPGDDAAVVAGGVERARPAVDRRRHDGPRVAAEDLTRRGLLDVPQDGRPVIAGGHQEASVGREDGTLYGTLVAAGPSGLTARPEIEEADRSVIAADRERPAVR